VAKIKRTKGQTNDLQKLHRLIPLTGLTQPHFLRLDQAGTWISNAICGGLSLLNDL
jgi:hypothetical protein